MTNDDNAKIAKDALFNRKYVEIIFRKCNCVPLTNRESVDVMDMQTWFSLVIDNVKEALDSRDTILADLRRERDEAISHYGSAVSMLNDKNKDLDRLTEEQLETRDAYHDMQEKSQSLEASLASARERERKIVEQFQIEVLSKNDFYYPKAICKNPPVIPRSGVNGCLSCQVSATCLLVNEMSESIESSTPPRSKVTGNPKTYEFVHKVIRPILQKHFIYGDDFNDAEVLRDIFESVTKFDAWSGGK